MQDDVPSDLTAAVDSWPVQLRAAVLRMLHADPEVLRELRETTPPSPTDLHDDYRVALNLAETEEEVAAAVLRRWSAQLAVDAVALGMIDRDAGTLRILFVGEIPAEQRERYHSVGVDGPGPMAEAARTGQPIVIDDIGRAEPRYRSVLRDFDDVVRSLIFHPLRDSAGVLIGALGLGWSQPRAITRAEVESTAQSMALAGGALARVRAAERERRIAIDLQEHLLDLNRSSTAVAVSAAYQPAAEAMRVGGDWYLVKAAEDPNRVAFCVGDVVGLGLPAATVMSRLRSAIAAASRTLVDPVPVLDLAERYARTLRGAQCATVAYAVFDSAQRRLDYLCAGHPYPLLLEPEGKARYLTEGRRPPLSAVPDPPEELPGTTPMAEGSLLVLYTDGLIERRGEDLDRGFARLAAAAEQCAGFDTGTVCAELLRRMAPPGGFTDDVALLAVRPTGTTPRSFVRVFPAELTEMSAVRRQLRDWLTEVCPDVSRQHDVLVSAGEALANAVEHGSERYPGTTVSLEVFAVPDGIFATVGDSGRWAQDSSASQRHAVRGRGIKLIHALSSYVQTTRSAHGTRVTMHHGCACHPG
jgi:anti-sigma regulatory factor (Ser/Thr protein kinase)/GAF domain-containing protein